MITVGGVVVVKPISTRIGMCGRIKGGGRGLLFVCLSLPEDRKLLTL